MPNLPLTRFVSKCTSEPNLPSVLLFGSMHSDMSKRNFKHMCDLTEHNDWFFSTLTVPEDLQADSSIVRQLPAMIGCAKLIIVDALLGFDAGLLCGIAENTPSILYRPADKTHSPMLKLVNGVCYSVSDLSFFFDTFNHKHHMAETRTKILSALTVISKMRLGE